MSLSRITITTCGCYFEYETDHSKPYLARWVLCSSPACERVQGETERVKLLAQIRQAERNLKVLRDSYQRRYGRLPDDAVH